MTKIVRLNSVGRNRSYIAFVDDEDYDIINGYKWYVDYSRAPTYYAMTGGKGPPIKMHRLVLRSPKGLVTSHKNGNGLDNRRSNLETTTYLLNGQIQRTKSSNTSGVSGVKKNIYLGKVRWAADITVLGKRIYLGLFSTFEAAAKARKDAELKYRGEGG